MAGISKKSSTVFIPKIGPNTSKQISVLVFYPGIKVKGKTGKYYMPPLIQKAVPGLFDSYVVVIPDEHTTSWDSVKSEYTEEIKKVGLEEIDLSIGIFSGSGNGNTSIQKNLNKLKLKNLFLMDPSGGNSTAKYQKDNGANVYLMYNPNNWKDYPTIANNFTALAKIVGANSVNTQSKTYDHEDIPGKLLKKWITDIDKSLTTPGLVNQNAPVDKNSPITPQETKDNKDGANTVVVKSEPTPPKYDLEIIVDGSESTDIVVNAKQNLPEITVFIGGRDPFEQIDQFEDLSDLDEEYLETSYRGEEEINAELEYDEEGITLEKAAQDAAVLDQIESAAGGDGTGGGELLPNAPVVQGKWTLVPVDGEFVTNSGKKIKCVVIDGSPVNVSLAGAFLDMQAAAAKDGITLDIGSGFRSPYDTLSGKAKQGYLHGKVVTNVSYSASSQKYLYDGWKAGKKGFNQAAEPGRSNHGSGIAIDLNSGGNSGSRYFRVNNKIYEWLVKNSWRYGFVRTVSNEEWHYDYRPDVAHKGPYAVLAAKDTGSTKTKFYNKTKDGGAWGLDQLKS